MKQHVLIISNMYPGKRSQTFGIFIKSQVEQLMKRGWQTRVVAIRDPRSGKFHVLKKYLLWMIEAFVHVLLRGKSYDAVHVHYVFPAGIFGLLAKKLWNRRLIVTVHGGDIDKMARKNKTIFNWTKRILQEADQVICVGEGLYNDLREDFKVDKNKLAILSMGVDQTIFSPADQQQTKKSLHVSDEKMILFVGNLIKEKGIMELLAAFKIVQEEHPEAHLHLIGPKKQVSFYKEVEERIVQLELSEKVHYQGALSAREVAQWMNASDMLILPSWMEGFGLVALEAMSCGTPVVGTDVGGLSRLLSDECGIKVPVKEPEPMAEAMKHVLDHPTFAQQLIENGLQRAHDNSSDNVVNKVIDTYKGASLHEHQTEQE